MRRRLRALMKEQGLSVAQLAVRAELSRGAIYDILERRSKRPRQATIEKLAEVLHVKVGFLNGQRGRR